MAESAALRREIRRRKILENSEARLNKIFGNGNTAQQISQEKTLLSDFICDDDSKELVGNGFSLNDNHESRLPNLYAKAEYVSSLESASNVNSDAKSVSGVAGSISGARDYEFPKKVSDTESRSYCRSKSDCHRRNSCKQLVMDTLQIYEFSLPFVRTWLVVSIAILTRCWLFLDSGAVFYESILIPLLTAEVGILIYSRLNKKVARSSNSFFGGILILCRVDPSVAETVSTQINIIQETVKDFSLYLCFFTLFHVSCEQWL